MRNRFFLPQPLEPGSTVTLAGEEFHHAFRVHRTRTGEEVELFDGGGVNVVAVVRSVGRGEASAEIVAPVADAREPHSAISLGLALIQPERFELVLQKGTELGVTRFIPLLTEHGEVRWERVASKLERWQKIVLEAVKQSGRARIPAIEPAARFEEMLRLDTATKTMFDSDEPESALREKTRDQLLLVGPEGGWSARELAAVREGGCSFRRLGPRRLRAETAAIAATAIAISESGW
jgi:16S rRNA (uracil1498-N3)-methyltransferase